MGIFSGRSTSGEDGRYGGALSALAAGVHDVIRSRRRRKNRQREPGGRGRPGGAERMDGAWCLVTGASSGLGFETAVRLIERVAELVDALGSGSSVLTDVEVQVQSRAE